MDARALADLRELAARDAELSARAARLHLLDAEVASIRLRADETERFFALYAEEERRHGETVRAAHDEVARRRAELDAAERELADAHDEDERVHAGHAVERARDHLDVATAALARAEDGAAALEREAVDLTAGVPTLEERARAVAAEVPDVRDAPAGVRPLAEWASHAHAELFVAAGQIDTERDRVIRQANELATMVLGEPTYGSTVAQLAERVLPLARK